MVELNADNSTRVVHVVPALFSRGDGIVGGAERYAFELARHMADVVPTTLVTFGQQQYHEVVGNLRVRVISGAHYIRGQRTNPFSVSLFSELHQADVVHCHQRSVLISSFSALFCRATRRRVFVTDLGGGGWDISAYLNTDRWYHGHLHISEYSRRIYGHTEERRASVILGGVDSQRFSPDERIQRNATALFVGRIVPHKGIDDLVRALPYNMTLEIIGQPYDEAYTNELRRLGEGKHILIRHDCDDDAVIDAYRRASCVVLPSVYRTMYGQETKVPELLGQTLLEGMACGAPAVCTDVASMPEVVENEVTGFVVPPNDPETLRAKLIWLRHNPLKGQEMGQAARLRVLKKFTWSSVVRRCLEIYSA